MKLLIVTHCYAFELPQYGVFMRSQLKSLLEFPPQKCDWKLHVICWEFDTEITKWLQKASEKMPDKIYVTAYMGKGPVFRRAVGRNLAAKINTHDLVWFTDVDHIFHEGCLDALADVWEGFGDKKPPMIFPKTIKVQKSFEEADKFWIDALKKPRNQFHFPPLDHFEDKHYNRAIGGVQICSGPLVRQIGYLDGDPLCQSTDGRVPFPDFRDDVKFRSEIGRYGDIVPIELPGLYRLRHTKTTYQGQVHMKEIAHDHNESL